MRIKKNVKLAPYTTFNIGGPADYFCKTDTKEEIIELVKWAKKKNLDYFILGGGTNILVSDKGFRGLAIKIQNSSASWRIIVQNSKVRAGAGFSLVNLLKLSIKHSLSGLEYLAGIPGTVGGAISGNAGTKKEYISQVVEKVVVLGEDGLIYDLNNNECEFEYRKSRFQESREIILEASLKLKKGNPELIEKKISDVLKTRIKQPKGKSSGSFFKNPPLAPAGELIEKAGLKGKKIGGAMISKQHANWIINFNNAKAADVLKLASLIRKEVEKKFKVKLEREIRLVGEF